MIPFLKEVAADIIQKYGTDVNFLGFVFPNKRAGLFFRKYFGELAQKTVWSPNIYDIQSFVKKSISLSALDKTALLYELYEIFKEVSKEEFLTFDAFFSLGEIMLSDFNEMDNYLVNVKQLFSNIKDYKEIGEIHDILTDEQRQVLIDFWGHFNIENASTEKQKFLSLWEKIPVIYDIFTQRLLKRNLAYQGLMNRRLVENIENVRFPNYQYFIFIGFSALNQAEEEIFNYLNNKELAKFYWDADSYYVNDFRQESGLFLRKTIKNISKGEFPNFPSNLRKPKNIELIGVPKQVGQTKLIPTLLKHWENLESFQTSTAIVLADEHLLFPVLHSIPTDIGTINVTMGYPLKDTSLYSLVLKYLKLQSITKKSDNEPITQFYYKDVVSILRHPEVWYKDEKTATELIEMIETTNRIYVPVKELIKSGNTLYGLLFTQVADGTQLLVNVMNILYELFIFGKNITETTQNSVEDEYIYQTYVSVQRLKEVLEVNNISLSLHIAVKLLMQMLAGQSVAFSGEPLEGIQVMGLLETRLLDFENVIILSLNEGILPQSTSSSKTMISEFFRAAFNMPNIKHRDSIFAYYFYRLLQRAENIFLVYNNITGDNGSGELSRFVQQLQYELGTEIPHTQFKQDVIPLKQNTIVVEKNEEILKRLNRYLFPQNYSIKGNNSYDNFIGKRFSASAINAYLDCKLRFYFKYLAGLKEKEEVTEEVNQLLFGNLFHKTMENLYQEHILNNSTHQVEAKDIEKIETRINENIEKAFREYFKIEVETELNYKGNQLIIKEVIEKYVRLILEKDKNYAPFTIISLETESIYNGFIEIKLDDELRKVALTGTFDRIDEKDNAIRIIDYKTGSITHSFGKVEELFDCENEKRNKAVMQMLYYCMLYEQRTAKSNLTPAIIAVRELISDDFNPSITCKIDKTEFEVNATTIKEILPDYKTQLQNVLQELFTLEIAFSQTENKKHCEYCPYKVICGE